MSWKSTALKECVKFILYGEGQIIVAWNSDRKRTSVLNIGALSAAENMEKLKEVCNSFTKCYVSVCEMRFVANTAASTMCQTPHFHMTSFWHFQTDFYVWTGGIPALLKNQPISFSFMRFCDEISTRCCNIGEKKVPAILFSRQKLFILCR